MNLNEYRQHYADLQEKVTAAQNELDSALVVTQKKFNKLYAHQQMLDKSWFVRNLSFILKHKEFFKKGITGNVVVDFLTLYRSAGMVAGAGWGSSFDFKVYLKDLIDLWDNGFTYNGYPIISYNIIIHNGYRIMLEYVKLDHLETVSRSDQKGENPLHLPKEIIEKVKSCDITDKYPDWTIYNTISVIRKVLDKEN